MSEIKPDIRSLSLFSDCAANNITGNLFPSVSSETARNGSADQGRNSPVPSTSSQSVEHTPADRGYSSYKRTSNDSAGQEERNRVASTSTQFPPEVRIIVKDEIEESYVEMENTEIAQFPPQMMDVTCSTSAVAEQSTPDVRRSKQKRDWSKNIPKADKKFSEGCLVMGRICDYPWPGMIRKAGEDDHDEPDFVSYCGNGITFCVQFFKDPITVHWMHPRNLRIFNAAKPNRGNHKDSKDVADFKRGVRIAKAASNYSVEARLEKFTLPNQAPIDCSLAEVDDVDNISNATATRQPLPFLPQNDAVGFSDSPSKRVPVSCSTSATRQQSKRKLMRSKGRKSAQPASSKKVQVPKPHEKYLEGCLVMARIEKDYPLWPGMIRKPGADDKEKPDYISKMSGKLRLFVQFFSDQTFFRWQIPGDLRVFNAAKPNRCNRMGPNIVISFEKGMRIARAASKFSEKVRLEKFTLPNAAAIDDLLAEIDSESFHNTTNAATQQPHSPALQNDSHALDTNATTPATQENRVNGPDLVSQHEEESALPTNDDGESCRESVEEMMKRRILEYQQKLRDECNREKDEKIKRLTTDKEKLETTVKQLAKEIADLHEQREKEKLEYKHEMQEKMKYKHELETMKEVFEKMFPGSQT